MDRFVDYIKLGEVHFTQNPYDVRKTGKGSG